MTKSEPVAGANIHVEDGIIWISFVDTQGPAEIKAIGVDVKRIVDDLKQRQKPVYVVCDASKVNIKAMSPQTMAAARAMADQIDYDAAAVISQNKMVGLTTLLLRISRHARGIKVFSRQKSAVAWIHDIRHPADNRLGAGLLAGVLIVTIAVTTLVGWIIGSHALTSWFGSQYPMNPSTAMGLLLVGTGFIVYYFNKIRAMRIGGIFTLLGGVIALTPLQDHLLLNKELINAAGADPGISTSAAICLIAMGVIALTAARVSRRIRILEIIIVVAMAGLSLFNIYGLLYAHTVLEWIGQGFSMSWNAAVAFMIAALGVLLLTLYRQFGRNILREMNRISWLIVISLVLLQIGTYGVWKEAIMRNDHEVEQALNSRSENLTTLTKERIQSYTDSLRGFRGFFNGSDFVSSSDFKAYYDALQLEKNNPGLRSVIYISAVPDKQLAGYVKQQRQLDTTATVPFTVKSQADAATHFLLTYVAQGSNQSVGLDLASISGRGALYTEALQSSSIYNSPTVTVPSVNGSVSYKASFIIVPVNSEVSKGTTQIGLVNAVLKYDVFFASLFKNDGLLQGVDVEFYDTSTGETIFKSNKAPGREAYATAQTIPIANNDWKLQVRSDKTFGIGQSQTRVPATVLIVGQLFSLFLIGIFILLSRSRRQGYVLADAVTADLQRERNIAVSNLQKNNAILESIGDAVFAVDNRGRITLFNKAAQNVSGYSEDEAVGKSYADILQFQIESTGASNNTFITKALGGAITSMANHTVLIRKDGKAVPVADSAAPIRDSHGVIMGAIVVFRDVTTEYALDKAKNEFVSLASHQLRTPLSAINWYGEMLLSGDAGTMNPTQQEYVGEIYGGSQRMIELINALLDVSRIEVGKLTTVLESVNPVEIVKSLHKELTVQIEQKHLRVDERIESLPDVITDTKQLRMVFQNLMSNAVKYTTEKGTVSISLRPAATKEVAAAKIRSAGPHLYFNVTDSGFGIPDDQKSKIFTKMFRADNVRVLDVEGTGLGLYIVKEVVDKMGGKVWFDSTEGKGTSFTVIVPCVQKQKASV